MRLFLTIVLCLFSFFSHSAAAIAPYENEVYIEDMTWPEIRDRLRNGARTAIIPTGGTEQNGPHIITGKHNYVVYYTAGEAARRLGNVLVAPVLAYVPEGRISPPEGHMRFPGTLSLSETTFSAVLEDAARSLKQHGFTLICFMGDHGGNQPAQTAVADKLNAEWRGSGVKVVNVTDYYAHNGQKEWLAGRKIGSEKPEAHAGFLDTAEMLARKEEGVRTDKIAPYKEADYYGLGAAGNPTGATAEMGRKLLSLKIDAAVAQIRNAQADRY